MESTARPRERPVGITEPKQKRECGARHYFRVVK
jgi:hypothetical protein